MGHDIIAGDLSDNQVAKIVAALDITFFPDPESFTTRLDDCDPDSFVATLRRSAYDPYNRVLYRALSAEHLYAGCSGRGEALLFTRVDIKAAYDALPGIVADKLPPIDTREADELFQLLKDTMPDTTPVGPDQPEHKDTPEYVKAISSTLADGPPVEEERQFLLDILLWMEERKTEQIRIYFG